MADGVVGVQQASAPDRFIDNNYLTNDGATPVYRQRVEDPELMALVRQMVEAFNRIGAGFDTSGRMFVRLTDAAGTAQSVNAVQSGTWNVATVTTVTGLTQMGGYNAAAIPAATMYQAFIGLRNRITVS